MCARLRCRETRRRDWRGGRAAVPGSAGQCGEEVQMADAAGIMQADRCVPRTAPRLPAARSGGPAGQRAGPGNAQGMWADDAGKLGRIGQRAKEGRRKKKKKKRKWRAKKQWANRGRAGRRGDALDREGWRQESWGGATCVCGETPRAVDREGW